MEFLVLTDKGPYEGTVEGPQEQQLMLDIRDKVGNVFLVGRGEPEKENLAKIQSTHWMANHLRKRRELSKTPN